MASPRESREWEHVVERNAEHAGDPEGHIEGR
jgi:hypothetical protein